jgi:hypothetical protein
MIDRWLHSDMDYYYTGFAAGHWLHTTILIDNTRNKFIFEFGAVVNSVYGASVKFQTIFTSF